jgi:undecaprenyl-diphosphatase
MTIFQIAILAIIQGLAELLPVSSSAHVIAVAKLMHLNPSSPQFTLLLVMLHTGTMFAVILYFWKAWQRAFFSTRDQTMQFIRIILIATAVTGVLGFGLKIVIEKAIAHQHKGIGKAEIEELFDHLEIIAASLAAAGLLILISGIRSMNRTARQPAAAPDQALNYAALHSVSSSGRETIKDPDAVVIGAVQGLSLPFRGFSRSGSTISAGLLLGIAKTRLEEYSFALAVVLTPPVVLYEARRLIHSHAEAAGPPVGVHDFLPSLIGMVFSFFAGLVALKLLSRLLEDGKWWVFGIYCLVASGGLFVMYSYGY